MIDRTIKDREKKQQEEKRDRNIARFCGGVLLVYGVIKIFSIPSDFWEIAGIGALVLPWYLWILLLPLLMAVLKLVFRFLAFVFGIDLWFKDCYDD